MVIDPYLVVKDYDVLNVLRGKAVAIYGAGADGKLFYRKYQSLLQLDFFIAKEKPCEAEAVPTYSVEEAVDLSDDRKIVICSRQYAPEMIGILEGYGLKGGSDFWVWDLDYTLNVKQYIEHNQSHIRKCTGENVVLVPVEGCHDGTAIVYSYFAPFFAENTRSKIVGFIRQGGNRFESVIYPSVADVYRSFGMEELIRLPETGTRDEKIDGIYQEIIGQIETMDDWESIVIDGLECGISFLRDYLRKYQLSFDPHNPYIHECLIDAIKTVLFWNNYFQSHCVKTLILWDGVHNESYLRDIAINHGVKTYIIHPWGIHHPTINFHFGQSFQYLYQFFEELTDDEKKVGLEWAKKSIQKMFLGKNGEFLNWRNDNNVFHYQTGRLELPPKDKVRVLICPHIFNEDQWCNGQQLCGNNYISWLQFVGDIADKTDYDWYIKLHPDEAERGNAFIGEFVRRHDQIKMLPKEISPFDLKEAGFDYALTIAGSIGHEYPLLGIDVIHAGNNPHIAFDFTIMPKTKSEYEDILLNIQEYSALEYREDIYKYYCVHYLYGKRNDFSEDIRAAFPEVNFYKRNAENTIYMDYLTAYSDERALKIRELVSDVVDQIDAWKPNQFYKNNEEKISRLLQSVE